MFVRRCHKLIEITPVRWVDYILAYCVKHRIDIMLSKIVRYAEVDDAVMLSRGCKNVEVNF